MYNKMNRFLILTVLFSLISCGAFAQGFAVSGKVYDENGDPIPGANVLEKGTMTGTITDTNGNFDLNVSGSQATLVFSFVGYLKEEISLDGKDNIEIILMPDLIELSEIVVIGYGTRKKSDVSASMVNLNGEELIKNRSASMDKALQGKLAGVNVTSSTGQPGGGVKVKIRGLGGLGSGDPLYVIDGVIINGSTDDGRVDYTTPTANPLSSINPSDIESINVLKDASATAIYGSRGANGVVLISTKRGQSGETRVQYDGYYGIQQVTRQIDVMNAQEFVAFSNEARSEAGMAPFIYWDQADTLGKGTNWQDELFRSAPTQNHQLSISGGNKHSKYYTSFGYMDQDGIVLNSGFQRYSLRVNTDHSIKDWLKVGNSLSLSKSISRSIASGTIQGVIGSALRKAPTLPVYTEGPDGLQQYAGHFEYESFFTGRIGNPVRMAKDPLKEKDRNQVLGNIFVEAELLKGLKFKSNVGFDYHFTNNKGFNPTYVEYPIYPNQQPLMRNTNANASFSSYTNSNLLLENTLTYTNTFFEKHNLSLMVGYTGQVFKSEFSETSSRGHRNNDLTTVNAGRDNIGGASASERTYVSMLGRFSYNYDNKYYLTANFRRDGASMFGENNKYANFPSFSSAWRVTGEEFAKDMTWLNDLKLRFSWGRVGDDEYLADGIPPQYAIMSDIFYVVFDNELVNGYAPSSVPNKNLKWETAEQVNIGIDAGFFENKITLTADYFEKERYNIITEKRTPRYMGVVVHYYPSLPMTQQINFAETIDKGFELSLGHQNYDGKFRYDIYANFSSIKNKVTRLDQDLSGGQTIIGDVTLTREGQPLNQFYGYVTDGIFQSQEEIDNHAVQVPGQNPSNSTAPGDIRYKDINGRDSEGNIIPGPDGVVDEADRTFIGNPLPDYIFGLFGNMSYKGFDLSYQLQGVYGNSIFNANFIPLLDSRDGKNKHADMVDRWHPENNPDGSQPRANTNDPNDNARVSDRYIEDGSYLKLSNVELGYSLPDNIVNRININRLRCYFSLQNAFTLTKYRGYDPDVSAIDSGIYPQARVWLFGVNFGL